MCNCPNDEQLQANSERTPSPRRNDEISPQDQNQRRKSQPCNKARRVLTYEDETLPEESQGPPEWPLPCSPSPPSPCLPPSPPLPCLPPSPGPCSPPPPPSPSLPPPPRKLLRCDPLTGVAIVRRRLDFATSPERKDETSKQAVATEDDKTTEEIKEESNKCKCDEKLQDKIKAKEKEKEKDEEKAKEKKEDTDKAADSEKEKDKEKEAEKEPNKQKEEESAKPNGEQSEVQPATPEKEQLETSNDVKTTDGVVTSTPCPGKQNPEKDCTC